MTSRQARPDVVIVAPELVARTLASLTEAVGEVALVGGWAVQCRLKMARRLARATSDADVILGPDTRPARAALEAAAAIQDDPHHPCRLSGLPLLVDVLADGFGDAVATSTTDDTVVDADGLRLLVPPYAALLARAVERVRIEAVADGTEAIVALPYAGALFAAKVANIALELRPPEKRASDGEGAVRLLEEFGALALAHDVRGATSAESGELVRRLEQLGGSALAAQARVSGYDADVERTIVGVEELLAVLRR